MIQPFARAKKARLNLYLCIFLLFIFSKGFIFSQNIEDKITIHKLDNGMTFVFMERHEVPVFAAVYGFKAGSVDEKTGQTGIAHILEHMAFKGTSRIGTKNFEKEKVIMEKMNKLGAEWSEELRKAELADPAKIEGIKEEMKKLQEEQSKYIVSNEIFSLYQNAGGMMINAGTSTDFTRYTVNLPSNQLELWCLVESERMKNPVFREFYSERSVVQQERKQVIEGNPARRLNEVFIALAFTAHPYRNPVIGWASDIESITLEEVVAFRKKYYSPNNCVAVLVGDIAPDKAIPLVEKYFGDIPRGPDILPLRTVEPAQLGENRFTMKSEMQSYIRIGYHKPTRPHKDSYSLSLIAMILSTGRSSRMQKDLVQDRQIASQIFCSAGIPGQRCNNLFLIQGVPLSPHTNQELEEAIYEHLKKLKAEPVKERELQRIKNLIESSTVKSLAQNFGMANQLWTNQILYGDWKKMLEWKEKVSELTPEDLMEAAKKYFNPENRTVAYMIKIREAKKKTGQKIGGLR